MVMISSRILLLQAFVVLLHAVVTTSFAFNNDGVSRKVFLETSITTAATTVALAQPANAVLSAPGRCASGVGTGCEELAGDNEYIKQLQAQSAAKKEQYQKEALNAVCTVHCFFLILSVCGENDLLVRF